MVTTATFCDAEEGRAPGIDHPEGRTDPVASPAFSLGMLGQLAT